MSKQRQAAPPAPASPQSLPTIHEAGLASGPSGAVEYGAEIDLDTALARRQAGGDVVVCGDDLKANRSLARTIESAVGPCMRSDPHDTAGPEALPHFQPAPRPPDGHTFYETPNRKARRRR